jgi:hypothetical protein
MIFDTFIFNDELDLLEIRLSYLDEVVDRFVLCESTQTFSGNKKPLYFRDNINMFSKYSSKIIHLIFEGPFSESAWINENNQRNFLIYGIKEAVLGDVIILADLDEIPSKHVVSRIARNYSERKKNIIFSPQLINYAFKPYFINKPLLWKSSRIFFFDIFKHEFDDRLINYNQFLPRDINMGITMQKIRFTGNVNRIAKGGWHLSYFMENDLIISKLKSFAHYDEFDLKSSDIKKMIISGNFLNVRKLKKVCGDPFRLKLLIDFYDGKNCSKLDSILIIIEWYLNIVIIKLKFYEISRSIKNRLKLIFRLY